jgi:hypothetical protein
MVAYPSEGEPEMGELPGLESAVKSGVPKFHRAYRGYRYDMYFQLAMLLISWLWPPTLITGLLIGSHFLLIAFVTMIGSWTLIRAAKGPWMSLRLLLRSGRTDWEIKELVTLGPSLDKSSRHLLFVTALSLSDGRGLIGYLQEVSCCPVLAQTRFFTQVRRGLEDLFDL